ncbi:HdeD family acid-resistance protein [Amycolatopsis lurida]
MTHHAPDVGGLSPSDGLLAGLAKAAWQAVLAAGVIALPLGVVVLVWPGPSLVVAGVFFGAYLLVSGIFQVVAAFGTHASAPVRVLAFLSGALSIVLGVFCFSSALRSVLLLALWVGIGWLFRGVTQTMAAAADVAMPARGWQAFLGIISGLGGIVLIVSPLNSIAVLTVLTGCWLLVVGVVEIVTALRLRARIR